MSRFLALVVLSFAAAGCIDRAEAQPRRRTPRRRPAVTRPVARPAPTPAAPAPGEVRFVVERREGDWEARCVAVRGCSAPRPLTRCPQPAPNVRLMQRRTVAEVTEQRTALVGQRVSARGTLRAFLGCSELACPTNVCCNGCFSPLRLAGGADAAAPQVQVGADRDPVHGCQGDDSGLCCGTEVPTGEVLVTGTLRAAPGGGALRLDAPQLCAL
jgi:hypothetical protein